MEQITIEDRILTMEDRRNDLQAGNPIVVMKDGQMVWLKPEEIQV